MIIGDTPADISCARAGALLMGASGPEVISVGVCTGFATTEALAASRPHILIEDLAQGLDAVLGALQSGLGL